MTSYIHKPTKQDWHGDPSEVPWPLAECLSWPKLEKPPADVLADPPHYLVIDGDGVRVATAEERAAIDAAIAPEQAAQAAAELAERRAAAKALLKKLDEPTQIALRALIELFVQEINRLRTNPTTTYPAYTAQQVRDALVAKIDALT